MPQNYMTRYEPPLGNGKPLCVTVAQIIAVRFCYLTQRTQNRHGVRVHIGERGYGIIVAGDFAAGASGHVAVSLRRCPRGTRQPRR